MRAPQQDDVPPAVSIQLYAPLVCQNEVIASTTVWVECGLHRPTMNGCWTIKDIFYSNHNGHKLGSAPHCFDHLQRLIL